MKKSEIDQLKKRRILLVQNREFYRESGAQGKADQFNMAIRALDEKLKEAAKELAAVEKQEK